MAGGLTGTAVIRTGRLATTTVTGPRRSRQPHPPYRLSAQLCLRRCSGSRRRSWPYADPRLHPRVISRERRKYCSPSLATVRHCLANVTPVPTQRSGRSSAPRISRQTARSTSTWCCDSPKRSRANATEEVLEVAQASPPPDGRAHHGREQRRWQWSGATKDPPRPTAGGRLYCCTRRLSAGCPRNAEERRGTAISPPPTIGT